MKNRVPKGFYASFIFWQQPCQRFLRPAALLFVFVFGIALSPRALGQQSFVFKKGPAKMGELVSFDGKTYVIRLEDGQVLKVAREQLLRIESGTPAKDLSEQAVDNANASGMKDSEANGSLDKSAKNLKDPPMVEDETAEERSNYLIPSEADYEDAAPYSSPEKTFFQWKKAAIEGDIPGMVNCYAEFRQKAVKKELKKMNRQKRKEMKAATARSQFYPNPALYQGNNAMLEITWRVDLLTKSQVLSFLKEGEHWKIVQ